MSVSFLTFIDSVTKVPSVQAQKFEALVSEKHLQKGEKFIGVGESPRTIAFVRTGLFRYYYLSKKGVEYTKSFFDRNSVLSAYDAILENKPSCYTIEALEDSMIESVDYDEFHKLFSEDPCWNEFLVALLQKGYLAKVTRERELLLLDAEQALSFVP